MILFKYAFNGHLSLEYFFYFSKKLGRSGDKKRNVFFGWPKKKRKFFVGFFLEVLVIGSWGFTSHDIDRVMFLYRNIKHRRATTNRNSKWNLKQLLNSC